MALLAAASFLAFGGPALTQSQDCTATVSPDESIQSAIDTASDGDVICLEAGTWETNLVIEKGLTLEGTNQDATNITSAVEREPLIRIQSYSEIDVAIHQMTVAENDGFASSNGVEVRGQAHVMIDDLTVMRNAEGIRMEESAEVTLRDSSVAENRLDGIVMEDSVYVTLRDSEVVENGGAGISLFESSISTITGSAVKRNVAGGISVQGAARATIQKNTIQGNEDFGIFSESDEAIHGSDNRVNGNCPDLVGNVSAELRIPSTSQTDSSELSFPGSYETLQATVDAVAPGGTVSVASGSHQGCLTIGKPLTLEGVGSDEVTLGGPVSLVGTAQAVEIAGVTIADSPASGLLVAGRAEAKLTGLAVQRNRTGIRLFGGSQATIRGLTVAENELSGIHLTDSAEATLHASTVAKNEDHGIDLEDFAEATIRGSTVTENEGDGIEIVNFAQASLRDSTVAESERRGIHLMGSAEAMLSGSTVTESARSGIHLMGSAEVSLRDSTVAENEDDGTYMEGFAQATVRDSTVTENWTNGISMRGASRATVIGSTIEGNGATLGVAYYSSNGIWMTGSAKATIKNNVIKNHAGVGVVLFGSCQDPSDVFEGHVTGSVNTIPGPGDPDGNEEGAVCPSPELDFLTTENGGKYSASSDVDAPNWLWAERDGGSGVDTGRAIAVDDAGNALMAGTFAGTAEFGEATLTSAGSLEVFVAKYDARGNVVWAERAGGSGPDEGRAIAVDGSGNALVAGTFAGTAEFGDVTLASAGEADVFVAKYDAQGNVVWAQRAGGSSDDRGWAIAVDGAGNALVTGWFAGTAEFGDVTLASEGDEDAFVAKYDAQGNVVWAQRAGGSDSVSGHAIAVDRSGNALVTGAFSGTAEFGEVTLASAEDSDVFVAKVDPQGNVVWAQQAGGSTSDFGRAIAVDGSGNALVTGWFAGTAEFGDVTLASAEDSDVFVAKVDPQGNVVWARRAGGSSRDLGAAIAVDGEGNALVTGEFTGTAEFGESTLASAGSTDVFVAKYDTQGNVAWATRAGGSLTDRGFTIAVDESGSALVTGDFQGTAEFGESTLASAGSTDVFVAKLDSNSEREAASRADNRGLPFSDGGDIGGLGDRIAVAPDSPTPGRNARNPTSDGAAGLVATTPDLGLGMGERWDGHPGPVLTLWGSHRAAR